MKKDLIIEKPVQPFCPPDIDFMAIKAANDPVPVLRLYCTMYPNAHRLQIRATAPLGNGKYGGGQKPRNLIASVDLSIEDLRQIAEYLKQYDK